jgi:eukaryotic-like serine/threonine-protein kinase
LTAFPSKIGKYEVLGMIGRGGMGEVYKARDPQIGRFVAIKMITANDPSLVARFFKEARNTGSLQHPNIVTVYDFGDQDGNPYLVMQFLEGASLESIIASGNQLSLVDKLGICIDICNGLGYAHQRGIIHRDIKPANVMVQADGTAIIVDFGIARLGDTGASRTALIGSLHYMSPEQFRNQPFDFRTDIFSTGVLLYRLLTSTLPFDASDEASVMHQIIYEDAPPLSTYIRDYPSDLDAIVAKALTKNRDDRYLSARDLSFDLLRVQEYLKQSAVDLWLQRAQAAIQRGELAKAQECLEQVLRIEKHSTQAHRLLGDVQSRIRRQQLSERARQLRTQADEAMMEQRYDQALKILDEAISLDDTNTELRSFRESVQAAKALKARLQTMLTRAEVAHAAGDLEEAQRAVDEALLLDPHETSAKALRIMIAAQFEEQARQRQVRTLLDEARNFISSRDITKALEKLDVVQELDSASVELQSLRKVAIAAREQLVRREDLERLNRKIEDALAREDYVAAIAAVDEGLQKFPGDQGLLKLKRLAESQEQRIAAKIFVRDQYSASSALLDAGKIFEALAVVDSALKRVPGNSQLESLRSIIKDRLTIEETDQHKRSLVAEAQRALERNELNEALPLLEAAEAQFPGDAEISTLLRTTREALTREKQVTDVLDAAQQLLSHGGPEATAEFLGRQVQFVDDLRVQAALKGARRQAEQFRRKTESALAEANRILRDHGTRETWKYLQAQPEPLLQSADFKSFSELLRKREACETLDRELAKQSDPDVQLRMAEEAVRRNPSNPEIQSRLDTVRQRSELIATIVDHADALETSGDYGRAAQELGRLRQLHKQYPNIDREIQRLRRLEDQQRALSAKPAKPENIEPPSEPEPARLADSQATRIMVPGGEPAGAPSAVTTETQHQERTLPAVETVTVQDLKRKWIWAAGVLLLMGCIAIAWMANRPTFMTIRINATPGDSVITVDGRFCAIPCAPNLSFGAHTAQVEHQGYLSSSKPLIVKRGGAASFEIALEAQPPTPAALGTITVETNVEGAEVFVDKASRGATGKDRRVSIQATPGPHEVTLRASGYKDKTQTTIVEGSRESSLNFKLERGTTQEDHQLLEGPSGAEVKVDQRAAVAIPASGKIAASDGTRGAQSRSGKKDDPDLAKQADKEIAKLNAQSPSNPNAPLVAQIDDSINKGDLSTAKEKLQSLSPSDPDYQRLTSGLDDAIFVAKKSEADTALIPTGDPNRQNILSGLRSFFANYKAGSHASEAAAYASKIEVAMRPSPVSVSKKEVSSTITDQEKIAKRLQIYKEAFQAKDPVELRTVWPTLTDKKFKEMTGELQHVQSIDVSLECPSPEVAANEAVQSCQQNMTITSEGRTQKLKNALTFRWRKFGADGDWVIVEVARK